MVIRRIGSFKIHGDESIPCFPAFWREAFSDLGNAVAAKQQRQRALDEGSIFPKLGGNGESQHPFPRHRAGHAVIHALDGLFELFPFDDALLPIDLGFEEIAYRGLGCLAETARHLIPAVVADRIFHDAFLAVVMLVDHPASSGGQEGILADFT